MTFSPNHKTVFVIDQSRQFLRRTCQQTVEFDVLTKTRQPITGIIPLAPISKSLWTCAVEAITEYCRIVWDIFPKGERLIRFVAADVDEAYFINRWAPEEQNLSSCMESFAKASALASLKRAHGSISHDDNTVIMNGLTKAINALCEMSHIQIEKRKKDFDQGAISNRGRIVCISSFRNDTHIRSLEDCFYEALQQHNKLVCSNAQSENTNIFPVNHCELIFLNTFPIEDQSPTSMIMEIPRHERSLVSTEVYSVKSGKFLAAKLGYLVLKHYDLASTTVTGIPMKEEQNASSSANYDVEIVHPYMAHFDLFKSLAINVEGLCVKTSREGVTYDTVSLKWCTPRSSSVELHYCTSSYRITSIEVNSRPSLCLTNFLLSGRSVMLEMPRSKGSKILSHMLSSHCGELYIHTLGTGRSVLEDPPSISEGSGGRVTDYRINDYGEFMKKNSLVMCRAIQNTNKETLVPIEKAKQSLIRQTLYYPMVIGHSVLFNIQPQVQQFLNLIPKDSLTVDDINECKKVIYQIVGMESKGNALPVPTIGIKGKGPKREELYRFLWNELEYFLRSYCVSAEHSNILTCLLECRAKPETQKGNHSQSNVIASANSNTQKNGSVSVNNLSTKRTTSGGNKSQEAEWAWKELDRYNSMSEREKSDLAQEPAPKKLKTNPEATTASLASGPQSLLQIWTNKINNDSARKRAEFAGRVDTIAPLYTHLNNEQSET